jgi:osmotically-inducible protein OsmY
MKKFTSAAVILILALSFAGIGCSRGFVGGAAVGAAGTSAAYEYQKHKQMKRLEDDFKAGRISKEEYLKRKEQISQGSLIY